MNSKAARLSLLRAEVKRLSDQGAELEARLIALHESHDDLLQQIHSIEDELEIAEEQQ